MGPAWTWCGPCDGRHADARTGSVVRADEAERVARRVEVHAERLGRRSRRGRTDGQDRGLAVVEVLDLHVEVALLRDELPGPLFEGPASISKLKKSSKFAFAVNTEGV